MPRRDTGAAQKSGHIDLVARVGSTQDRCGVLSAKMPPAAQAAIGPQKGSNPPVLTSCIAFFSPDHADNGQIERKVSDVSLAPTPPQSRMAAQDR